MRDAQTGLASAVPISTQHGVRYRWSQTRTTPASVPYPFPCLVPRSDNLACPVLLDWVAGSTGVCGTSPTPRPRQSYQQEPTSFEAQARRPSWFWPVYLQLRRALVALPVHGRGTRQPPPGRARCLGRPIQVRAFALWAGATMRSQRNLIGPLCSANATRTLAIGVTER